MDSEQWNGLIKTAEALAPVAAAALRRNPESEERHTDTEKNSAGNGEDQEQRIEELERSMAYCYRIIQGLLEFDKGTVENLQLLEKKHGANRRRIKAIRRRL